MKVLNQTAQLSMGPAPNTEGYKVQTGLSQSVCLPACLLSLNPLLSLQVFRPMPCKGHYNEFQEVTQNPNFSYTKNKMALY